MPKMLDDNPVRWYKTKVKYVAELMPKCDMYGIKEKTIVGYAPMECIKNGFFLRKSEEWGKIPPSLSPYQSGDIVLAKVTPCFENGNIAIMTDVPSGIGFGSSELFVIRAKNIETKFLFYWLQNLDFVNLAITSMTGMGGLKRVQSSFINNAVIKIPLEEDQRRIVEFLDAKCAEIDALTAEIQAQIDTLEQYKRSVITEAVTKGLNPDAEMRESGIDYIEYIPAHWALHPLSYYFGERKKKNILGLETNLLSLSYGKIVRKDIEANGGLLPENFNTYNIIEAGDIIIRPTDLQNDKRSLRTGLASERGIITSAYIALHPIRAVNSTYFHYLLHAFDVMKVFYNMGNGVRQGLNYSEFSRLMVVEPPVEEQNAIVEALEKKCAEIDTLIGTKREQLATLADYKKSLIFEYVTGKKEVPAS